MAWVILIMYFIAFILKNLILVISFLISKGFAMRKIMFFNQKQRL